MKVRTVSFEALQRAKRRPALGEVTPEQLEEENSMILLDAKFTIPDFCTMIERHYGK
jgi:hypothetical protein